MSLESHSDNANDISQSTEGLPDSKQPESISIPSSKTEDQNEIIIPTIEIETGEKLTVAELDFQTTQTTSRAVSEVEATTTFGQEKSAEIVKQGGDPTVVAPELHRLEELHQELADLTIETPATTEFRTKVGGNKTDEIEIKLATAEDLQIVERAAWITYTAERAHSLAEVKSLSAQVQEIAKQDFEDDNIYDAATAVVMQEAQFIAAATPLTIENGATISGQKPVNIEVSNPNETLPTRPTTEELAAAWEQIDHTTRGKLGEVLAYLQDYEAVATNHFEPYQVGMPDSRRRELGRKSWFEEGSSNQIKPNLESSSSGIVAEVKISNHEINFETVSQHLESSTTYSGPEDKKASRQLEATLTLMNMSAQENIKAAGDLIAQQIELFENSYGNEGVIVYFSEGGEVQSATVFSVNNEVNTRLRLQVNSLYFNNSPIEERELVLIHESGHLADLLEGANDETSTEYHILLETRAFYEELKAYSDLRSNTFQDVNRNRALELTEQLGGLQNVCNILGKYHVLYPEANFSELIKLMESIELKQKKADTTATNQLALNDADAAKYFATLPVATPAENSLTISVNEASLSKAPEDATLPQRLLSQVEITTAELLELKGNEAVFNFIRRLTPLLPTDSPERNALIKKAQYLDYLFHGGIESYVTKNPGETKIGLIPPEDFNPEESWKFTY
ncbi:MAG: hypothetical protein NT141_01930 [candidate division WWE3 bacterium]|nr:hypothetical protein [candidate division WWE3 bacterium]